MGHMARDCTEPNPNQEAVVAALQAEAEQAEDEYQGHSALVTDDRTIDMRFYDTVVTEIQPRDGSASFTISQLVAKVLCYTCQSPDHLAMKCPLKPVTLTADVLKDIMTKTCNTMTDAMRTTLEVGNEATRKTMEAGFVGMKKEISRMGLPHREEKKRRDARINAVEPALQDNPEVGASSQSED